MSSTGRTGQRRTCPTRRRRWGGRTLRSFLTRLRLRRGRDWRFHAKTRRREAFQNPFAPSLSKDRSLLRAAQEDGASTSSARTGSVSFAPSRETKQRDRKSKRLNSSH